MIDSVYISGLKSFLEAEIKCKNLNIISGVNSSGKSTFIQAILLFFQTYPGLCECDQVGLNGKLVSLGDFRENVCTSSTDKGITIERLEFFIIEMVAS